MSVYVDDNYRIKRNSEQEEQMKYLTQELKIFQSLSQILVVSSIIGYYNKAFCEFSTFAEPVLMNSFSSRSHDIMDFIAYNHKKEQSVLMTKEKYKIFECYANGGFPILVDGLNVDFIDKKKNNRLEILKNYYVHLLYNDFILSK